MYYAIFFFGFSFLALMADGPGAAILLFAIGAVLAAGTLVRRFYTRTRIRLLELLLMTIVAGAAVGFPLPLLLARVDTNETRALVIGVHFCVVAMWAFAGVSNGILVAERLGRDNTYDRLWMIAVYLLLPVATVITPVACVLIFMFLSQQSLYGFLWAGVLFLAAWLQAYAWDRRSEAKVHGGGESSGRQTV